MSKMTDEEKLVTADLRKQLGAPTTRKDRELQATAEAQKQIERFTEGR